MIIKCEPYHNKEKNVFGYLPIAVDKCCSTGLLWFFKNKFDLIPATGTLVKIQNEQDIGRDTGEPYDFCQFCGKKHYCFYINDKGEEKEVK